MRRTLLVALLISLAAGCSSAAGPTPTPTTLPATATAQALPPTQPPPPTQDEPQFPPAAGPEPSDRVAAFYYPWYGDPEFDGEWVHWTQGGYSPPQGIGSDYYPLLGAYSSTNPQVVAQHFAWLRQAGVGAIIASWWGQGTFEDRAVPVLLEQGQRYGIQVAFHIEPHGGRTAEQLVDDIRYLCQEYGDHPAFFRTTASSSWSPDERSKGLFFLWAADHTFFDSQPVEAAYWRAAMDEIHDLPSGGLVIANSLDGAWVDLGHFDGLYNYASLNLEQSDGFSWALGLPPDAWYVPSVLPGFSARRVGYPEVSFTPRQEGGTYDRQWQAALDIPIQPDMVTITSFNEWHEGSQIEPAAAGVADDQGGQYSDYGPLDPEGYLELTRQWVARYLSSEQPQTYRARLKIATTSDWTALRLLGGGLWLRPQTVSISPQADYAWSKGDNFLLTQPLERAETGAGVELVVDILFADLEPQGELRFAIKRGHLGATSVEVYNYLGDQPVLIETFRWGGINPDEANTLKVSLPASTLLEAEGLFLPPPLFALSPGAHIVERPGFSQ